MFNLVRLLSVGMVLVCLWLGIQQWHTYHALIAMIQTHEAMRAEWSRLCGAYEALHREQLRLVGIDEQILALHQRAVTLHGTMVLLLDEQVWLLSQPAEHRVILPMPLSLQNRLKDP